MRLLLRTILISFIVIASVLSFMASTTPGLYLTIKLASLFLPGQLQIKAIEGKTVRHIHIQDLLYTKGNAQVKVTNLDLDWQLSSLLRGKIVVNQLRFDYNKWTLTMQGQIGLTTPYSLLATLQVHLKNKPQGSIVIQGNASHYHWQGNFQNPSPIHMEGDLKNISELQAMATWDPGVYYGKGQLTAEGVLPNIHINLNSAMPASIGTPFQNQPYKHTLTATLDYQPNQTNASLFWGDNTVTITGTKSTPWQISASLPHPELFLDSLQGLKAPISIKGEFQNIHQGQLFLQIKSGQFEIPNNKKPLAFEGGLLGFTLSRDIVKAKGNFTIDPQKKLHLEGIIQDQKITGNLELRINDLAFIEMLDPLFSKVSGQLTAQLQAKGNIRSPQILGHIALTKGHIFIKKLGVTLHPLTIHLQSDNSQWKATGTLISNDKLVDITGKGSFFPAIQGFINITGDTVPIMNTDQYRIWLSPDLKLEFSPEVLALKGKITIPKAEIKPQTFQDTVSMSSDAVFVGEKAPSHSSPITTNIQLDMGEQVALVIGGLSGSLKGGLVLEQKPYSTLKATGQLSIFDGKYQAYGQQLEIEQGQLLFNSNQINNPDIRLKATKLFNNGASFSGSNQLFDFKANNLENLRFGSKISVGVEVNGPLSAPKIQLSSNSGNISQADILSMLLLGKPANQASTAGGQLLLAIISSSNLGSGSKGAQLLSQLKQSLGLDFNVDTNQQFNHKTNQNIESTSFMIGKALSKRLYLSYNMGISEANTHVITLKYLLNKFFSVQINTDLSNSGIDLLYTKDNQ